MREIVFVKSFEFAVVGPFMGLSISFPFAYQTVASEPRIRLFDDPGFRELGNYD